ncbi:MAG: F0F1 ATP synthase subunit epsilon [Acholeplasmatales bacterium]|nr:F0F1 ATP synthase subunit epsilon [Acholeplasmatales bacterium]
MRIVVSTHQGNLYDEEVDYIVVHSDSDGAFGIMENHVPVVSIIDEGYVKLVRGTDEYYIVIISGVLEFHNNMAVVLVQEAHIGQTPEYAKKYLEEIRKERLEKNRQETADFTQKERELREHLKNANAGSL